MLSIIRYLLIFVKCIMPIINKNKIPCYVKNNNTHEYSIIYKDLEQDFRQYQVIETQSKIGMQYNLFMIHLDHTDVLELFDFYDVLPKDFPNNTVIMLAIAYDAYYPIINKIYQNLIVTGKFKPNQIYLPAGSAQMIEYCKNTAEHTFNSECIHIDYFQYFEQSTQRFYEKYYNLTNSKNKPKVPKITYDKFQTKFDKKFICLNRAWRNHRQMMLCMLKSGNLLKDGYISYSYQNKNDWDNSFNNSILYFDYRVRGIANHGYDVYKELPLFVDTKNLENFSLSWWTPTIQKYYNNCYFSLTMETNYHFTHPNQLTEKTFKTILYKKPAIIASAPYHLKVLRNAGYKTFDGIINESYDKLENDSDRLLAIYNEVKRLCKLDSSKLSQFVYDCSEIVEFNFQLLMDKETFVYDF